MLETFLGQTATYHVNLFVKKAALEIARIDYGSEDETGGINQAQPAIFS